MFAGVRLSSKCSVAAARAFIKKPAVTREGQVHHRELMCRIFDGNEEVSSAEYMPMVLQFGLSEEYDRLQISRLIPLLRYWYRGKSGDSGYR